MNRSFSIFLVLLISLAIPCSGELISSVDAAKEIYNQTGIEPAGWVDSEIIIDIYGAAEIHYAEVANQTIPIATYFWPEMSKVLGVVSKPGEWPAYPIIHDVRFGPFTMVTFPSKERTYYSFMEIADVGGGYLGLIEIHPNHYTDDRMVSKMKVSYKQPPKEWTRFMEKQRASLLFYLKTALDSRAIFNFPKMTTVSEFFEQDDDFFFSHFQNAAFNFFFKILFCGDHFHFAGFQHRNQRHMARQNRNLAAGRGQNDFLRRPGKFQSFWG